MDANKLLPDFNAIGKTNWSKPEMNTKDTLWLVSAIGAFLMFVFLFLPWFGISDEDSMGMTRMGISMWPGIFALIGTVAAIVGVLYNHNGLAFCGATLSALFALISLFCVFSLPIEVFGISKELPAELIKEGIQDGKLSTVRYGAILHLICALVTGGVAFLKISGYKFNK